MERKISLGPLTRIRAETVSKTARLAEWGGAGFAVGSLQAGDLRVTIGALVVIAVSEGVRRSASSTVREREGRTGVQ